MSNRACRQPIDKVKEELKLREDVPATARHDVADGKAGVSQSQGSIRVLPERHVRRSGIQRGRYARRSRPNIASRCWSATTWRTSSEVAPLTRERSQVGAAYGGNAGSSSPTLRTVLGPACSVPTSNRKFPRHAIRWQPKRRRIVRLSGSIRSEDEQAEGVVSAGIGLLRSGTIKAPVSADSRGTPDPTTQFTQQVGACVADGSGGIPAQDWTRRATSPMRRRISASTAPPNPDG